MKKDNFKSALALILIFAVFALILAGVNVFTAPIIESNGSAQELAPLLSVMPEAKGFETLYDVNASGSTLAEVPETVQGIYAETSGLGYALRLSTTQGYTGEPIELTMAVDAEGKISGIALTAYPDSKDFGAEYPGSFLGQDSAMAEVGLVAGVTYSSKAFKDAVSDGFAALIANGLVGAGVKSEAQLLLEQLPAVFPGMVNAEGVAQYEERELAGGEFTYIQQVMKAANGCGFAYVAADGDKSYLAVCNAQGACRVYDAEGADVTGSVNPSLLEEVTADAAANQEVFAEREMSRLGKLVAEGAELTALPLDNVFSTVTGAYLIKDGGTEYYGFSARALGYSNLPMICYFVLDGNGAIVAMTAEEFILMGDYFTDYELDEAQYKAGFAGLTADTWTGEQALISGATVSSNAVADAATDVFDAFKTVTENGGEGQ